MEPKGSVLIVDDDESTCRTISLILRRKGFETKTAMTGRDAIKEAQMRFYNLALLDLKIPDMTGIEVLRIFREKYPARMNIIITAHATLETAVEALNLGANAYIMKPIDHEALDQLIKECLQKQKEAVSITQEKLTRFLSEIIDKKSEEEDQIRLMQKFYQKLS